jgi:PhzF family phenazine biosynthesis protein
MKKSIMQIPLYHVDAFTDNLFGGNPAAVCVLPKWLPDNALNAIARENNQPVTAFLVSENEMFIIRWITPEYELDICGHGSLAAAYVIFNYLQPNLQKVHLQSRSELLEIVRCDDLITLNFPTKSIESCSIPLLAEGFGLFPKEIYQHNNERCFAVFDTEEEVKQLKPDINLLKKLPHRGITITAPGREVDFVSRTFYPQKMISEDAATGASHCLLVPYWSKQLNKMELSAKQLSKRGGMMFCQYQGERILISGRAVLYMQGSIHLIKESLERELDKRNSVTPTGWRTSRKAYSTSK